ncbi:MAG: alpha-amylase/4-alpha-glucanotransferase domain-containing protein [Elusimicrobiaceae bacterium]
MIELIFCVHNHQPVGNFDHVLDEAYDKAYYPFVEALMRFPEIKANLHFTGILYDWFEKTHPEYLEMLARMAHSGQAELLSGAYYEPPLAVLPEKDRQGQILKMNSYIRRTFGVQPRGMWLAERIWEPALAAEIDKAGIDYTVLDDLHFFYNGKRENDLTGYFTAEYEGRHTAVFPISKKLRYLIPFKDPQETIDYLKQFRNCGDAVFVMADDGEKFGLWPETHSAVYGDGWLERFFSLLIENSDWLRTSLFSEVMDRYPSKGLCYLPASSYFEFTQWALLPDAAVDLHEFYKTAGENLKPFLRGGQFRDFIAKYPEVNRMYRKGLLVSEKVHAMPDGPLKDKALDYLWQAQCNCGYWHGVFGGLYLAHLRGANHANLIRAEKAVDEYHRQSGKKEVFTKKGIDFDGDGQSEVLIEGPGGSWYFNPAKGGCLFQWDVKKREFNLINNISRRKEAYHADVAKAVVRDGSGPVLPGQIVAREPGLSEKIFYDWHDRNCLLDHFLLPSTSLGDFKKARYGEQGDFVVEKYTVQDCGLHEKSAGLALKRKGNVWCGDRRVPVTVEKNIIMCGGGWKAEYRIHNNSGRREAFKFGLETAFLFSDRNVCGEFEKSNASELEFKDNYYGNLKLTVDKPCTAWGFPLETVSQSEGGFEMCYQGSVVMFVYDIELPADGEFRFALKADV